MVQIPDNPNKSTIHWVIKTRILRWVGHVVHMGDRRGEHRVLMGET
jgi:hypothetical protein